MKSYLVVAGTHTYIESLKESLTAEQRDRIRWLRLEDSSHAFGVVPTILSIPQIPTIFIHPSDWKKSNIKALRTAIKENGGDKIAHKLFPEDDLQKIWEKIEQFEKATRQKHPHQQN